MKQVIAALIFGLSLSAHAMAETVTNKWGMYCALDAEGAAIDMAKKLGATEADIANVSTASVDKDDASVYLTTIGQVVFEVYTEANDGQCIVTSVAVKK